MLSTSCEINSPIMLLLQISTLFLLGSITHCDALTAAEQQELLNIHNKLRAGEGSSNMQVLTWNSNLAYMAQDWANKCVWAHGQAINSSSLGQINVGQNMYQTSAAKINLTSAVVMWFNEKVSYNYTTNSCAAGQVCGHYTQVVWSESNQLGCGYASNCSSGTILVCNYGPAGNMVGSLPYAKGPACTQCSSGSFYCTTTGLCNSSCKAASAACVCKAACKNCGKTATGCKCQCSAGWTGVDCSEICKNRHVWCDPAPGVPGWPKSLCGDPNFPTVPFYCPLMCGKCAPAICPTNFTYSPVTGSCYLITNQPITQVNAQKSCAAKSSHLVYIDSEAEKNVIVSLWLAKYPGQIEAAWIGACRVGANPKPFVWSPSCSQTGPPAGTKTYPMTYTSWLPPAEPNNNGYNTTKKGTGEWCVEMYNIPTVGYIWNDLECTAMRGSYICETAPKC